MPEPIAETYVEIKYDSVKNAQNAVDQFGKKFENAGKNIDSQAQRISKSFTAIASVVGTIGIAKLGNDIIQASTKFDAFNRMLVNVEGNQDKANKRFKEFRELAKAPILDPMNLSKYYVSLKSLNIEAEKSIPFMKNLANAMAGVGASNEQFALAMEQFTQMIGKGKVMGDDLRAIANSFPQIRKYLVEAFGTAIPDELAQRGVTAIDVMTKLNAEMEKAPKYAGGAQAAQDNFRQSLEMFEASLGKAVLPAISEFLSKMTELIDTFNDMPEATQKVIGAGAMIGIGGAGLIGIASTLKSIVDLAGAAKTGLAAMSAVSVGANGTGVTTATSGFMSGSPILQIATATIAAGTVIWAGNAIYKALTRDFTDKEKEAIRNPSQAKVEAGLIGLSRYDLEKAYAGGSGQMEAEIIAKQAFRTMALNTSSMNIIDWSEFKPYGDYNTPSTPVLSGKYYSELEKRPLTPVLSGKYYSELEKRPLTQYGISPAVAPSLSGLINLSLSRYISPMTEEQIRWANMEVYNAPKMKDRMPAISGGTPTGLWSTEYGVFDPEELERVNAWLDKEAQTLDKDISASLKQINGDWKDITETQKVSKDTINMIANDLENRFGQVWDKIFNKASVSWKQMAQQMLSDYGLLATKTIGKDIGSSLLFGTRAGKFLGIESAGSLGISSIVSALAPLTGIASVLGGFYWAWTNARKEDIAIRNAARYSYNLSTGEFDSNKYSVSRDYNPRSGRKDIGVSVDYANPEDNKPSSGSRSGRRSSSSKNNEGASLAPINFNISLPNATLDSIDENQIERFIRKATPAIRRSIGAGIL